MITEFDLTGKTALVIGAGGGLGREQAVGLARAGADVAIADLNQDALRSTQAAIVAVGRRVQAFGLDITAAAEVDGVVEAAESRLGPLHILVNSAGMTRRGASEDYDAELFERILDTNLNGVFYACQSAGRRMMKTGGGRIINMGSIFSSVGLAESAAYSMSKGAVAQLTRALAIEWAPFGIAVNAILPSWFDTAMGNVVTDREKFYAQNSDIPSSADLAARTTGRVPMRRVGKPPEIVGATVFLASAAASMVTGHLLAVDGGFLAQ